MPWERSSALDPEFFWYEDHKAGSFYPRLDKKLGAGDGFAAPFTFMVAQVNFVHRWLRHVLARDSPLALRLRFLVCHHALRGLMVLAAATRHRDGPMGAMTAAILGSSAARALRKVGAVRNVFAHYDLREATDAELADEDPLSALVGRLGRRPLTELEGIVDQALETMSVEFRGVLRLTRWAQPLDPPAPAPGSERGD